MMLLHYAAGLLGNCSLSMDCSGINSTSHAFVHTALQRQQVPRSQAYKRTWCPLTCSSMFSFVLQPNVELYKDNRSGFSYRIPDSADIDTFRTAIEGLPGQESPEVYGLHPNADLTFRTLQVGWLRPSYLLDALTALGFDTSCMA